MAEFQTPLRRTLAPFEGAHDGCGQASSSDSPTVRANAQQGEARYIGHHGPLPRPRPLTGRGLSVAAAACVAAVATVWLAAFNLAAVREIDADITRTVGGFAAPWLFDATDAVSHLADSKRVPYLAVGALAGALLFRGPRLAAASAVVLAGANMTTQGLQPLLSNDAATGEALARAQLVFPSGHVTAAASLAFAGWLAAPPRLAPLVAAGGLAYTLAISCSVLIQKTHLPSDVLSGALVAAAWFALALVLVRAPEAHAARRAVGKRAILAGRRA
jgi:membrane-associated phospholipid phosphatase